MLILIYCYIYNRVLEVAFAYRASAGRHCRAGGGRSPAGREVALGSAEVGEGGGHEPRVLAQSRRAGLFLCKNSYSI